MTSLILCKFPLFSIVKLNLGHLKFLNVGVRLYFKLFPNSQEDLKERVVNLALVGLLIFFQFIKEMEYWEFSILAGMGFFH